MIPFLGGASFWCFWSTCNSPFITAGATCSIIWRTLFSGNTNELIHIDVQWWNPTSTSVFSEETVNNMCAKINTNPNAEIKHCQRHNGPAQRFSTVAFLRVLKFNFARLELVSLVWDFLFCSSGSVSLVWYATSGPQVLWGTFGLVGLIGHVWFGAVWFVYSMSIDSCNESVEDIIKQLASITTRVTPFKSPKHYWVTQSVTDTGRQYSDLGLIPAVK